MTEKRFTLKSINEQHLSANLYDDKTFIGSIGIGAELIVELLNSLNDENVKLRARNKYLAMKIQRERNIHVKEHEKWEEEIQKENEQLKQQLSEQGTQIDFLKDENQHMRTVLEENKQLKEELEQCKAVIDNRWSEYLQKKELME